ncbi:hypothetical protein PUNSTDRAFT_54850 [Punctularia strigosozonata HHB-11173 SS5]|uniref:uncharacterized protein n=1 Tax=Punctularia strigosozonata (strain HHB-11173) TaxID=741275 RepID=UPI0004416C17|nr:uncharacterized protein PUNSTDRAFT_54850 [Punctularia strigosozonata HHB-11173 SS5]EIN05450.1 hypothetical protein PUNSTDRAFT_54850 [Punctularia strigosozonata HHB-11173 SS5]
MEERISRPLVAIQPGAPSLEVGDKAGAVEWIGGDCQLCMNRSAMRRLGLVHPL